MSLNLPLPTGGDHFRSRVALLGFAHLCQGVLSPYEDFALGTHVGESDISSTHTHTDHEDLVLSFFLSTVWHVLNTSEQKSPLSQCGPFGLSSNQLLWLPGQMDWSFPPSLPAPPYTHIHLCIFPYTSSYPPTMASGALNPRLTLILNSLCSQWWPRTPVFLPQRPMCLYYRHTPPCCLCGALAFKPRAFVHARQTASAEPLNLLTSWL